MENLLRKSMFETPSVEGIKHCLVDEEAVEGSGEIKLLPGKPDSKKETNKRAEAGA